MKKHILKVKPRISRLLLVFFLGIIASNLFAQKLAEEQKKELLPKVQLLLKDYAQCSQFTTDGISLSNEYLKRFAALFDPISTDEIYNDLSPSKKGIFSSADQYVNFVKTNYQQGLDVSIETDNIQIVDAQLVKGNYFVTVLVHKKITGVFNNQKINRFNDKLYFLLSSSVDGQGNTSGFRINGILSVERYAQTIANKQSKAIYIGITGLYAQTKIASNASSNTFMKANTGSSIYPGFEVIAMFTKNIGVGVGVRLSKYSTTFDISNFDKKSEALIPDIDGDFYNPVLQISKLSQISTIKSLDIPLLLKIRGGKGKTKFYFDLGVVYSNISKSSFTLEGSSVRGGYYQSLNVTLTDIPEYGFGTYTYKSDNVFDLKINTTQFSAYSSLGLTLQIVPSLSVKAGFSILYGITELNPDQTNPNDYSNLISIEPIKNLRANSFEIGLYYRIPFKR